MRRFPGRAVLAGGLLAAALRAAAQPAPEAPGPDAPRIARITIRCENTFNADEVRSSRLYRTLDRARTITRPDAIRRLLLFREGEPLDEARLRETERNLRQLPFLKSARVTAGPPDAERGVEVLVVTQDSWTLVPGLPIASAGGTTTYGFQVSETDLFGSGRGLAFHYDKGIERLSRSVVYDDPFVFDSEYRGQLAVAWNSDGWRDRLELARPFVSLTTRRSERLAADVFRQTTYLYEAGDVSAAWQQDHRGVVLGAARALAANDRWAQRVSAGVEWQDDRFAREEGRPVAPLPDDRSFRFLVAGYELVQSDLLTLNYVNRDLLTEDFNLGLRLSLQLGVSPPVLGAEGTTGLVRAAASRGLRLDERAFLLWRAAYETRLHGGTENQLLSGTFDFAWKLPTRHPQTFVAKARYDQGWNLDRDVQFIADGLVGLRGYRLFSFTGDKRLIVNVEQRLFSGKELMHLFSPGLAFFVDGGTAAPPGTPLKPSELKWDAGIGFRMAITRAPTDNVYRIDLAWALDRDPKGRRGLLVSFSAAQGF